jgi:hypothetical protein
MLTRVFRKNANNYIKDQRSTLFSSSELKTQVSFSDRLLSGVRLSVCPSVLPSVRSSVNFYIFDFSRTTGPILTTSLGKGDLSLFKQKG